MLSRYIALLLLFACAFMASLPARAQGDDFVKPAVEETLEEKQAHELKTNPKDRFVTFAIENDNFASGTDRNYTSGARLSYHKTDAVIPEFFKNVASYVPVFNINDTTTIFWSVGQNLYTPEDITLANPDPDDRPYAAWAYGSAGLATTTGNVVNELELTVGMVGPAAFGEETQSFVHSAFNIDEPEGWDHQLKNEPGVILSWRRRWPDRAETDIGPLNFSLEPSIETALGNVYTYAGAGLFARLSLTDHKWQDMPPRVRPAMPGTGYFGTPHSTGSWYLFAGAEGRAVARNIFLDGNTFKDSPSVDKNHFVADLTAGLALTWKDIRVSYSATHRTPEFDGDDTDLFGAVTVTYRY